MLEMVLWGATIGTHKSPSMPLFVRTYRRRGIALQTVNTCHPSAKRKGFVSYPTSPGPRTPEIPLLGAEGGENFY